jgi:hypothetical protein
VKWRLGIALAVIFAAGAATASVYGGWTGRSYSLAVGATVAKTFAWWINQARPPPRACAAARC